MIVHKLFELLSLISILTLLFMLMIEATKNYRFTRAQEPVCEVDDFIIEYPSAWTQDVLPENPQADVRTIFALHSPDKNGHLYLRKTTRPNGMSLSTLDENMHEILGTNLISSKASNLSGYDTHTWNYMWPAPNTNPNVLDQCQDTAAIMESCIITVSFCSETNSFYRYHSEFDIILASVKFSKN